MHVIVTGGSSGIGLEVARFYAARGASLTLIARDPARLENARLDLLSQSGLSPANLHIAAVDVSINADIAAAVASAEAKLGPCDILIASAGVVEPGFFDRQSAAAFDDQITTNLFGTVNAIRAVYPGMKRRGHGRIMMVSSGAALIGLPGYAAYCASKSALIGFAEALSMEAATGDVCVSICFPPDTLTPQLERELLKRPPQAQRLMGKASPWTAKAVAQRIVGAVDKGKPKLYFGFSITALGLFGPLIKPVLAWWYRPRSR